jgi:hypothetical protein
MPRLVAAVVAVAGAAVAAVVAVTVLLVETEATQLLHYRMAHKLPMAAAAVALALVVHPAALALEAAVGMEAVRAGATHKTLPAPPAETVFLERILVQAVAVAVAV